ncbi:MAG: hypothetical protein ACYCTH_09985 [Cellulomonas sp.]
MTRPWRGVAVILAMGVLSGCSVGASGIGDPAASQLQATVKEVAVSAAGGDYAAAVAKLATLQSQLDRYLADGQVGGDRGAQIQTSIDQVRADLGVLLTPPAPAPVASPTVTQGPSPAHGGNDKLKGRPKD